MRRSWKPALAFVLATCLGVIGGYAAFGGLMSRTGRDELLREPHDATRGDLVSDPAPHGPESRTIASGERLPATSPDPLDATLSGPAVQEAGGAPARPDAANQYRESLALETTAQRGFIERLLAGRTGDIAPICYDELDQRRRAALPGNLGPVELKEAELLLRALADAEFARRLEVNEALRMFVLEENRLAVAGSESRVGRSGNISIAVDAGSPWGREGVVNIDYFLDYSRHPRLAMANEAWLRASKDYERFLKRY